MLSVDWPPVSGLQPKIGELGCEDLLYAPLPDAAYLGHLVYAWDPPCHDNVTQTHPTKVEEWPHWESDVKMSLSGQPSGEVHPNHISGSHLHTCCAWIRG